MLISAAFTHVSYWTVLIRQVATYWEKSAESVYKANLNILSSSQKCSDCKNLHLQHVGKLLKFYDQSFFHKRCLEEWQFKSP